MRVGHGRYTVFYIKNDYMYVSKEILINKIKIKYHKKELIIWTDIAAGNRNSAETSEVGAGHPSRRTFPDGAPPPNRGEKVGEKVYRKHYYPFTTVRCSTTSASRAIILPVLLWHE